MIVNTIPATTMSDRLLLATPPLHNLLWEFSIQDTTKSTLNINLFHLELPQQSTCMNLFLGNGFVNIFVEFFFMSIFFTLMILLMRILGNGFLNIFVEFFFVSIFFTLMILLMRMEWYLILVWLVQLCWIWSLNHNHTILRRNQPRSFVKIFNQISFLVTYSNAIYSTFVVNKLISIEV